jgi:hypothetical protein
MMNGLDPSLGRVTVGSDKTTLDHLPIGQVGGLKCKLEVTGHAEFIVPSRGPLFFFFWRTRMKTFLVSKW